MAVNVPRLRGPRNHFKADIFLIGGREKNMNRKDKCLSGSEGGLDLGG
jgi:hypothetical protein